MNKYLYQALSYLDLGWWVFPCREKPGKPFIDKFGKLKMPKEKSPYTKNGFKDASNDPALVKEWWLRWDSACIGVSCEHSGLFLIDIDVKNGKKGIDNYMQMGITDTGALHSRTPSKGLHMLFKGAGKSSTNVNTGIDTRGEGGYFIAPPSEIIGGIVLGRYIALDNWDHNPEEISIFDLEKLDTKIVEKPANKKSYSFKNNRPDDIRKAKSALENLPSYMVDNYADWINIGMSLYSLEDDGLNLWKEWSKKSDKYEDGVCEEKWDTFSPDELTIGSLFYYSKEK